MELLLEVRRPAHKHTAVNKQKHEVLQSIYLITDTNGQRLNWIVVQKRNHTNSSVRTTAATLSQQRERGEDAEV